MLVSKILRCGHLHCGIMSQAGGAAASHRFPLQSGDAGFLLESVSRIWVSAGRGICRAGVPDEGRGEGSCCVVVHLMCVVWAKLGVFWGCLKRSLCGYAGRGKAWTREARMAGHRGPVRRVRPVCDAGGWEVLGWVKTVPLICCWARGCISVWHMDLILRH